MAASNGMKHIILVLGLLLLAACAGEETEVGETAFVGAGASFITIGISYEKIWTAAEASLAPEFVKIEGDRLKGTMKARKGAAKSPDQMVMGISITPLKQHGGGYRVKATMLKYKYKKGKQRDWPQEIVDRIQAKVN